MLSLVGMSAYLVCDFYGLSPFDISVISKRLARSVHNYKVIAPELDKTDMINELLHIGFGHSVLPHFDTADISLRIYVQSTGSVFFHFLISCLYFHTISIINIYLKLATAH